MVCEPKNRDMSRQHTYIIYSRNKREKDMRLRIITAMFVAMLFAPGARAQLLGVKTNLLYDATATINAGVEIGLAPNWTLDLSGNYNGWTVGHDDKRWKHWLAQPEARYWFCDCFAGHFLAAHLVGGQYNWGGWKGANVLGSDLRKLEDNRYQGWFVGIGVAYGYSWVLNRHWSMEAEVGIGYAYTRFDQYPCANCGNKSDTKDHHYVGPTKLALDLIYVF